MQPRTSPFFYFSQNANVGTLLVMISVLVLTLTLHSNSKDLLKIFLATDLHLGHLENDPIRGDDSFVVFEEILQKAKDQQVYFF